MTEHELPEQLAYDSWVNLPLTAFDTETDGPIPTEARIVTACLIDIELDGPKPRTETSEWLLNIGREIIGGLIKGIEGALGGLTSILKNVTDMIPKNKGPIEKDRVLLKPAGQEIMQGLIAGIMSQTPALLSALAGITTSVPLTVSASTSSQPTRSRASS